MEGDDGVKLSVRQVAVLTAAALAAPAADLLPGRLAGQSGGAGWMAPVLTLPLAAAWVGMLLTLYNKEGSDLQGRLRQSLGPVAGWFAILLYVMWALLLLMGQIADSSARMAGIYGEGAGRVISALVVLLALRLYRRSPEGVFRAGELFCLALAAVGVGVLLLSLPRMRWERLIPAAEDWRGLPGAVGVCAALLGRGILAAALIGNAHREKGEGRRLMGWACGVLLFAAGVTAAVLGQVGGILAVKLEDPFFVMVQGLSLEGGFARLEAPVAALWLMADFAGEGLFLSAVGALSGMRVARWSVPLCAILALLGQDLPQKESWTFFGSLILGFCLPAGLWIADRVRKMRG